MSIPTVIPCHASEAMDREHLRMLLCSIRYCADRPLVQRSKSRVPFRIFRMLPSARPGLQSELKKRGAARIMGSG
jgi:hypothetical protein